MNHANTMHYCTIEDGGLSETMRRIEMMIRKHAPLLMRLPDNYSRQPTRLLSNEQKLEVIRLFNAGQNAYTIAKQLNLSDRAVRYYKRYAKLPVCGDATGQATGQAEGKAQAEAGGGSLMRCARAAMPRHQAQ